MDSNGEEGHSHFFSAADEQKKPPVDITCWFMYSFFNQPYDHLTLADTDACDLLIGSINQFITSFVGSTLSWC